MRTIPGLILSAMFVLGGCSSLPSVEDITHLETVLHQTSKIITEAGQANTKAGAVAIEAIDIFERKADSLRDVASQSKTWSDAVEGIGNVASTVLPPPWGSVALLGTTLLALGRARQNRLAGRSIARAIESAAIAGDGAIVMGDGKTKAILKTMGPSAESVVAEGRGRRHGVGV